MNRYIEERYCVLCGHSTYKIGEYGNYAAMKCFHCGLICTDRLPDNEELSELYRKDYYANYYNGMGYKNACETYFKKRFRRKIKLIKSLYGVKNIDILEVGCGPGYFIKALNENGFMQVTGYEISNEAISEASKMGIALQKRDILKSNNTENKYDLVISWATIEHTLNPQLFFDSLMKYLRPGGYLLIDTGIADTFFDRKFKGLTPWFYPPEHLYVFTTSSLFKLAEGYQTKRVMINYYFPVIQLFLRSIVILKHLLAREERNIVQDIGILIVRNDSA
jgi:SAM-dependent methyltransferase